VMISQRPAGVEDRAVDRLCASVGVLRCPPVSAVVVPI
jgi:hypothetical protein